jgi:hypothetical protein
MHCSISEYETLLKSASFNQKADLINNKHYRIWEQDVNDGYFVFYTLAWLSLAYLAYRLFLRLRDSLARKIIQDVREQKV